MVADLRKMQENQGVSENRIDKFGFTTVRMVTGVMPGNESFPVTVHVLERQ